MRLRQPFVFAGPVAHGGEDAFDGVGRSDVLPMLGWEVVEGQQHVAIFGQLLDRPLVFHAVGFHKQIKGCSGLFLRLCHPDVLQPCLGLFMQRLGHRARDVSHLVDPAALFFRRRVHVPQCGPKTQAPSPQAKSGAIVSPRFFRLRRRSRQLSAFSRNPSMMPRTSLSPYSSAPIITNIH